MAAIVDESCDLDLTSLAAGVKKSLPSYARPVFVRILQKVEMTGKVSQRFKLTTVILSVSLTPRLWAIFGFLSLKFSGGSIKRSYKGHLKEKNYINKQEKSWQTIYLHYFSHY